jgi:uncharacterized membrane protein
MMILALLARLPAAAVGAFGAALVLGHNALDGVTFPDGSTADVVWSLLHVRKLYALGDGDSFLFLYPLIPWAGVMALGYCAGRLYGPERSAADRRLILAFAGAGALWLFLLLRGLNLYGDPHPWVPQATFSETARSFLDLERFPPSLLYLCATLGMSLPLLAALEAAGGWLEPLALFGRGALFYYVAHLYLLHGAAIGLATLAGKSGFGFPVITLLWLAVMLALYPACRLWISFKQRHLSAWWVGYV